MDEQAHAWLGSGAALSVIGVYLKTLIFRREDDPTVRQLNRDRRFRQPLLRVIFIALYAGASSTFSYVTGHLFIFGEFGGGGRARHLTNTKLWSEMERQPGW